MIVNGIISQDTFVFQTLDIILEDATIEALLITKDGNPNGNLLGIIRPKEILQEYYSEWGDHE